MQVRDIRRVQSKEAYQERTGAEVRSRQDDHRQAIREDQGGYRAN
jgi:hypothetical protein